MRQSMEKLRVALATGGDARRDAMTDMLALMARERTAPPARIAGRKGRAVLGEVGFLRISRGDVVNLEHVREPIPWMPGAFRVRPKNGTELDVSRDRTRELKDRLGL